jgi:hypothetical protein
LLCPGDPPIDSYVLELKQNPEFDKMIKQMSVAADYSLLMSAGDSSQDAAEKAGRNHYMGERQAYRH